MKPKAIITVLVALMACTLIASAGTVNAAFPSNEADGQVQVQVEQPSSQPQGGQVRPLSPVGSGISYQGQLKYEGSPANGQYDFAFTLYDADEGGTQVGSPVNVDDQSVTEGVFKVSLDFGAGVFQGEARWLEIAVRPAGGGTYTTLAPRQPLTAVPYAQSLATGSTGAVITGNIIEPALAVTNTAGTGVYGSSASGTRYGVWGTNTSSTGYGVYGVNNTNSIQARGVVGFSNVGNGVSGISTSGLGVHGSSTSQHGGLFTNNSTTGYAALQAYANGTPGYGVYGEGNGVGVWGSSPTGTGTRGATITGYGVLGISGGAGTGVRGESTSGWGVDGNTAGGGSVAGVFGESTGLQGTGVWGRANNGSSAYGVWGQSTNGYGVRGESSSGYGLYGFTGGNYSVAGVFGELTNAFGYGVWGRANGGVDATGVVGTSTNGYGIYGSTDGAGKSGVYGFGGTSSPGVRGFSVNSLGVYGLASGPNGVGVAGEASNGASAWGVWGGSTSGYAGYFTGRVHVQGNFSASGTKNFKIDHPLDPANKYLYHASVESPDVMNMYNGNVTLDAKGEAWVEMPDYFEVLNRDFRYQLTSVGAPGPNLYVAEKVKGNRFKIAGGHAGMEVSWQVTGIRQDPYVSDHRTPVEADKSADEKGKYLYPQGYGQPESKGMNYERLKQLDQKQPTEPQQTPRADHKP